MSNNEFEHAKLILKALGLPKDIKEALKQQADTENYEWTITYPSYSNVSAQEGFLKISDLFSNLALIEEHHEELLQKILKRLRNNEIFKRDKIMIWICRNCGHIEISESAPEECIVCGHPKAYFEIKNDTF